MSKTITPGELGIPDRIPRPKRTDWRIGIVGYGGIAGLHVPAYLEAGWQVVAVADPIPEARQRAEDTIPGVCMYDNYEDLVADDGHTHSPRQSTELDEAAQRRGDHLVI